MAVYWAAAGGSLGGSIMFFGDDIRHGWLAAERTGRVVTTLALCINEYESPTAHSVAFNGLILAAIELRSINNSTTPKKNPPS